MWARGNHSTTSNVVAQKTGGISHRAALANIGEQLLVAVSAAKLVLHPNP
ncbi:hypothetical protein [Bradyrhizobium zhanjiangense]|nr:hypothetical protein [Bradyrhizobium zhanjiangense]